MLSRRSLMRNAVMLGTGATLGGLELFGGDPALAVATPTIASCATWGARDPSSALTLLSNNPNKILIHHTDTANQSDTSQAAAYALARSIQNYHMDSNGWSDTGQHFTISRGGYIMEGRHYSLSKLTAGSGMVQGAHCPGQNTQAIGIEHEGTYMTVTPPAALYNQSVEMCAYICSKYGIAPTEIYGHRDFYATDCPGDAFYPMLPQLRADVAAKLSAPAWTTTIDNTSSGFRASANWGTSTYSTQRYGADYRYANPTPASDAAYFSATLPSAGSYKLEVWYAANSGYNATTPHVVFASTGNQTVNVNQQANGGKWNSLGTFSFNSGAQDLVAVSRWTSGTGYVIADALKVTKV